MKSTLKMLLSIGLAGFANAALACSTQWNITLETFGEGVLVELNQSALHTWKPENIAHYERVLALLSKYHMPLLMSSDSHISYTVGNVSECERLLTSTGRDPMTAINYSDELIRKYLLKTA